MTAGRPLSILLALICAGVLVACGGDGDGGVDDTPTPDAGATEAAGRTAQRPDWFPTRFTLPPDTTVVSDQPEGEGGTVTFETPVPLSTVIRMFDSNWGRNGYTQLEREATDERATYRFEDAEHTGTVTLTPDGEGTSIEVQLAAK